MIAARKGTKVLSRRTTCPAAFLIGICETIIKGLPSSWNVSVFSDAFTFALLIVSLTCKPTGLFGEKATDKV